MPYFNYILSDHLKVPQKIIDLAQNLSYNGDTISTAVTPFEAQDVHLNFFNLAKSAIDTTSRITLLEALPQNATSYFDGVTSYSGRNEAQGLFYGGSKLILKGSNVITFPYDVSIANKHGFQIAVHRGINLIDYNGSIWENIIFGEGSLPNVANVADLVAYLNTTLAYSERNGAKAFSITGTVNPSTNWAGTFGNLSAEPSSFKVEVNYGEIVRTVTLSTSFGSVDLGLLASTLTNAINISGVSVVVDGSFLKVVGSRDRNAGGITHIVLKKTQDNSILDWLGLSKDGDVVGGDGTKCYDFRSMFEFVGNVDNTITLQATLLGTELPGCIFLIKDKVESDPDVQGFFDGVGSFGLSAIGANATVFKHVKHPLASYSAPLNYGGDFRARDAYFRNIYFEGSFNFLGTTDFEAIEASGLITGLAGVTTTTVNSTDVSVGITGKKLTIDGLITSKDLTVDDDSYFGTDASSIFSVTGNATFQNGITTPSGADSTIGGVNFLGGGVIDTLTINALNVSNLQASATTMALSFLRVNGTGTLPGYFNGGTVAPTSVTDTINFEGNLKASRLFATNASSGVAGSTITMDATTKEIRIQTSDARLKRDIVDLADDSLSIIDGLRPVRYFWKDETNPNQDLGFIAQELRKYIPEAVFGDEDEGFLTVNFTYIIPHLVKAVKTLLTIAEVQQAKIDNLVYKLL